MNAHGFVKDLLRDLEVQDPLNDQNDRWASTLALPDDKQRVKAQAKLIGSAHSYAAELLDAGKIDAAKTATIHACQRANDAFDALIARTRNGPTPV